MNRTTQFIMPLIVNKIYKYTFKCYLGINKLDDISGEVYLKFRENEFNNKIESEIIKDENCKGKTIINNIPIYLFKIPEEYINDYKKFLLGYYSEMEHKRKIYHFWYKNDKDKNEQVVFNTLFAYEDTMDYIAENLGFASKKEKERIKLALKEIGEVNSIPKLIDEIYYININNN